MAAKDPSCRQIQFLGGQRAGQWHLDDLTRYLISDRPLPEASIQQFLGLGKGGKAVHLHFSDQPVDLLLFDEVDPDEVVLQVDPVVFSLSARVLLDCCEFVLFEV